MKQNLLLGIIFILFGFIIFTIDLFIENINETYKLFGIPIIFVGVKKLKGEKL